MAEVWSPVRATRCPTVRLAVRCGTRQLSVTSRSRTTDQFPARCNTLLGSRRDRVRLAVNPSTAVTTMVAAGARTARSNSPTYRPPRSHTVVPGGTDTLPESTAASPAGEPSVPLPDPLGGDEHAGRGRPASGAARDGQGERLDRGTLTVAHGHRDGGRAGLPGRRDDRERAGGAAATKTTRLAAGTSVALELAAVTESDPGAVSTSPTVTVSGPTI